MADDQEDTQIVTLVDRAGTGGGEIRRDGQRYPIRPEFQVLGAVARWIFQVQQQMVYTTDGRYVHRLGIKRTPESENLIQELGPEVADCSEIEIDTARVEGWPADTQDPNRARATVLHLGGSRDLQARQGDPLSGGFAKTGG